MGVFPLKDELLRGEPDYSEYTKRANAWWEMKA